MWSWRRFVKEVLTPHPLYQPIILLKGQDSHLSNLKARPPYIGSMKKRTKIILIAVLAIAALGFFGSRNFEKDKNRLLQIKGLAANGNIKAAISAMEETPGFDNPPVHLAYTYWRNKFNARFVHKNEEIEHKTDNPIIIGISNIYRDYWVSSALEEGEQVHLDSLLMTRLKDFLLKNDFIDPSQTDIDPLEEIKRLIEKEEAYVQSFYLNETFGIKIWDEQTEKEYTIALPEDTLTITVVFIENYLFQGLADFLTMGSAQDGGWAINSENKLYCHKDEYTLGSEKFENSYLKHEANHFVDMIKYPKLSSADLEYRSKLIELMYSKKEGYTLITQFMSSASNENRNNAHAFANYVLISNLSELLFDEAYVTDLDQWNALMAEEINEAATVLYEQNNAVLDMDGDVIEVIWPTYLRI